MSRNRYAGLLFGFGALLLFSQTTRSEIQTASEENPLMLQRNSSVQRQLSPGGEHSFVVKLFAGQYFQLEIKQQGIDVATSVSYPDGKKVEFDTPSGTNGTEYVRLIAEAPGVYRLAVRSLFKEVDPGSYRLRVTALRSATAHDKIIFSAVAAQRRGDELRAKAETRAESIRQYETALTMWQSAGDRAGAASVIRAIGFTWFRMGNSGKAIDTFNRAAQVWHDARDLRGEAFTYQTIGFIYERQNNFQPVLENNQRALPFWRRLHDTVQVAFTLSTIGDAYAKLGNKKQAAGYCKLSLNLGRNTGKRVIEGAMLRNCGQMFIATNDHNLAKDYLAKSLAVWRTANFKSNEAITLMVLGEASEKLGEKQQAIDHYSQAQTILLMLNDQSRAAEVKARIARLSGKQ